MNSLRNSLKRYSSLEGAYLRLRPHSEWQEIETDIAGHVRASLNFTVGEGKNPQFLFSSGQRRTAGIAFLLAIHLSRPWCTFETLLLDDPVQHIDDYRALISLRYWRRSAELGGK